MSEKGEGSGILRASANMSVEDMKKVPTLPERSKISPSFLSIQDELIKLEKNPDQSKEQELKLQRARLINEAKESGVFKQIKQKILEIQQEYPYGEAFERISKVDTENLETEAKGLGGWKNEFSGMIEHYRDGALRNMNLSLLKATGNDQKPEADELKRDIDLLGWGSPPEGLEKLVRQTPGQRAGGIDTNALATEIAKAQGLLSPEQYLDDYRQAEEFLKAPFQIVPGAEPRFWVILNEKEKQEWIIRSTLVIAAYKKSMATGTDKLYMDEMRELAVDLNKRALKILFGSRDVRRGVEYEGVDGVLPAVGIYATIIGDKRFLDYKDQNSLSLKDVFCDVLTSKSLRDSLEKDYGEGILGRTIKFGDKEYHGLKDLEETLYKGCPDSMYPHDDNYGTPISQESFRVLRSSVRFWLMTKGRDLLLTEEELNNRDSFFEDKEKAFNELVNRARDAEQMAWNFIYSTSLLEHFDSRDFRPEGTKRHGPSNYWCLFQWVPMHLQERFEQKVVRGNNSEGPQAKEEWAGSLGTWAIRNYSAGNWTEKQPNGKLKINIPKILPDTLIRSALHPQMYETAARNGSKTYYTNQNEEERSFFSVFNKVGDTVLFHTDTANRPDLESRIKWDKVSDSPFVPFIFDEMRWADVVQNVFKKGAESRLDLRDPSEAVRNLRLTREQRTNLLIAYYGASPTSKQLRPRFDPIKWSGVLGGVSALYPNYFLEK